MLSLAEHHLGNAWLNLLLHALLRANTGHEKVPLHAKFGGYLSTHTAAETGDILIWFMQHTKLVILYHIVQKLANYHYTWLRDTCFSVASSCLNRNSWARPSSIHWCRAVASSSSRSNSSSTSTAASRICAPLAPRPVDYKNRDCMWKDVRFRFRYTSIPISIICVWF